MACGLDAGIAGDHGAQSFLALDEFRVLERGLHGFVDLLHHVSRRALGGVQTVPDGDLEVLEAHFLQCWQILERRCAQALAGGHGIGLHLLGCDLRGGVGGLVAQQVDLVAHQIGNRRRRTLVRHGRHFGLDGALQHQAAQVGSGTDTGICQVDLALVLAGPVLDFSEVLGGQRGAADQGHGHVVDDAGVLKVVQHVELQLAVQRRNGGHANVRQQQRVAIVLGACGFGGTNRAASAVGVVDHDGGVIQVLAHGLGQVTGYLVGRATGRERHDDGDGFAVGGIAVLCVAADGGSCGQGHGGDFKNSVHLVSLHIVL